MKKLLFILLCFIPLNVFAYTHYSDYKLLEGESSLLYDENDLLRKDRFFYYLNYKYEMLNKGYFKEEDVPESYIKTDDFILKEEITLYPDDNSWCTLNNIINDEPLIRTFMMRTFKADEFKINSIEVYVDDNFEDYIFTNKPKELGEVISSNDIFAIYLKSIYDVLDVKIKLNITSSSSGTFHYNYSPTFSYLGSYIFNVVPGTFNYIISFNDSFKEDNCFKEEVYYRYEEFSRVDTNIYTKENIEGYYIDLDNYIEKYDYYKRDKVIVNTLISSLDDPLILYTSADLYKVEGLSFEENGLKDIKICLSEEDCFNVLVDVDIFRENTDLNTLEDIQVKESYLVKQNNEKNDIKELPLTSDKSLSEVKVEDSKVDSKVIKTSLLTLLILFEIIRSIRKKKNA